MPVRELALALSCSLGLTTTAASQVLGEALGQHEIADQTGGFTGQLDDGDGFGFAATGLGDLDGDGIVDMAVGAWGDDDGGLDRGAIWILFLDEQGEVRSHQKISDTEGGFTGVLNDDDRFGYSLAGIGDHDGDGVRDLAAGAIFDDDGGYAHGAVWILFLNADGTVKAHQKISDTEGDFDGELHFRDYFGSSLSFLGDHDGDGIGDLVTGAYRDGEGEQGTSGGEGALWILRLEADGTVKSHTKIAAMVGGFNEPLSNRDIFGRSVAALGDLDGDGIGDLIAGAPITEEGADTYTGVLWTMLLNADGTVKSYRKISHLTGGFAGELEDQDRFGMAMVSGGDVNGDGVTDVIVASIRDDDGGHDRGAIWTLFLSREGLVTGTRKMSAESGNLDAPLADNDLFGHGIANLGDHDGDGAIELAIGARQRDTGGSDRGAVFYLDLKAAKTAQWESLGYSLAGSAGAPTLSGVGSLQPLQFWQLLASDPASDGTPATVLLISSNAAEYRPFFGGILVPLFGMGQGSLETGLTSPSGSYALRSRWPPGLPSGLEFYYQAWIEDAGGPEGYSATNTLRATTP